MTKKLWQHHRSRAAATVAAVDDAPDELVVSAAHAFRMQRADCCVASAAYRILLPATTSRPQPAELLLCGHHFHVSRRGLQRANASAFDAENRMCEVTG